MASKTVTRSILYTKRAIDHEEKDLRLRLRLEGSPKSPKQIFPLKKRRTLAVSPSMGEEHLLTRIVGSFATM